MKNQIPITKELRFTGNDLDSLFAYLSVALRNHSRRVAVCASIMAEYAANFTFSGSILPARVHLGGTCHDIGKLLIPTLSSDEEAYMRHPAIGAEFLKKNASIFFDNPEEEKTVLEMVRWHHEQPNRSGFPDKLTAKEIPLSAGICAIANDFDHLIIPDEGAYDRAVDAKGYILDHVGKIFCDIAVVCFEQALPQIMEQYEKWNYK